MIDIVFLGTPDFAVPSLKALVENKYNIKAVICQPDRPKGRGHACIAPPVKEYAQKMGIEVFQPEKIKAPEAAHYLRELAPDLMITAAFGQILSKENLEVPRLGCVNVHGSLLPKYRGAAPIQWAVINGEKVTGISTMYTEVGLDCGDIILQRKTEIDEDETAGELFDRLSVMGAEVLLDTVRLIEQGKALRIPQNHTLATHFPMLKKQDACIDFSKTAIQIKNLVRGMNPWPIAFFTIGSDIIKVYEISITDRKREVPMQCGQVIAADPKNGLVVAAEDFLIELKSIQFPNKRVMDAKEFLKGHSIAVGTVLRGTLS